MTKDARYLAALQAEQLKRVAERSFPDFVRQAWPILEPTTPFLPNWHIDLVCEYLEAVTAGEIRRLVINLPPRYGKSLLVSVLWPVWEWIPSSRDAVGPLRATPSRSPGSTPRTGGPCCNRPGTAGTGALGCR